MSICKCIKEKVWTGEKRTHKDRLSSSLFSFALTSLHFAFGCHRYIPIPTAQGMHTKISFKGGLNALWELAWACYTRLSFPL